MLGKLIAPIAAAMTSLVGGFVVLMLVVFIAAPDQAGMVKAKALAAVTFVITGVVDLVQAIFAAVMGAV